MYKVLDLFCGAGGLSFGFEKSKEFNIVLANDIMSDAISTYQANYPNTKTLCCDIGELSRSILRQHDSDSVDLILGGPPCQSFSTLGKRLLDDPRGKLFQEYLRLVKLTKPKVFVFENVTGLLSMDGGKLFNTIVSSFEEEGYNITCNILNAVDFGVPQNRKRVMVVGHMAKFCFPKRTHLNNHLSLLDAIGDLPYLDNHDYNEYICEPQNSFQNQARIGCNELKYHDIPNHGESLLKVIRAVPEGGSAIKDLPANIKPKSGFGNSYARLWWDKPSSTITRNFGTPSSARCIHPVANRALTTREGARIQSFPDTYIFNGSRTSKNLQIGNAVPPLLSRRLVNSVVNCLKKLEQE
jgi:DNA (cytosine-5)-methyltransferase 1